MKPTLRRLVLSAAEADVVSLWKRPRAFATATSAVLEATEIILKQQKTLEVAFSSGERYSYPAEYLRVHSEAASASSAPVAGRREVGIMGIAPVGNYGVRLEFDDLHHTGIYTWQHLHDLGANKWHYMREYIRELKQRGLSRHPPGRRRSGGSKPRGAASAAAAAAGGGGGAAGTHPA